MLLGLLLLGTLIKGVLWSQLIFPLDAPDEPSHFNYVMQVHAFHKLPQVFISGPGHLDRPSTGQDPATRDMLDFYGFTEFRGMPYESTQPPLYYVGTALLLVPLGEDRLTLMYAARLASVLLGVGTIWALWWGLRALWPRTPLIFWGVPIALSLLPQFTFMTSTVTNDAACVFFGALLIALWAGGLSAAREKSITLWRWGLAAGLVTALGLLSKLTMVVTVPGTLLWLWWLASASSPQHSLPKIALLKSEVFRRFLAGLMVMGAAIVVLVGWWVVRNLLVYGEPTGTRAIFDLYHRIYWSRQGFPPGQLFSAFPLDDFVTKTFRSFWAAYGWAGVVLDWWVYVPPLLLGIVALVGLVCGWVVSRRVTGDETPGVRESSQDRRRIVLLSALTLLLAFVNMLFYDSFVDYQPQARYLFIAVAPAFVLLVLGLNQAAPNPRVNRALVWSLFGVLILMQLVSLPLLTARWTDMAAALQ